MCPRHYNVRILFSVFTFWGIFNLNFVQICVFYSRKVPKKWTFHQKMSIQLKFNKVRSQFKMRIHSNGADTVVQKIIGNFRCLLYAHHVKISYYLQFLLELQLKQ